MQGDTIVQHYWPGTCSRTLPGPAGSLDTQHARQNFNRRERQKERGRQARGLALRRRAVNYVTRRMLITKSASQSMFRSEKLCKSAARPILSTILALSAPLFSTCSWAAFSPNQSADGRMV